MGRVSNRKQQHKRILYFLIGLSIVLIGYAGIQILTQPKQSTTTSKTESISSFSQLTQQYELKLKELEQGVSAQLLEREEIAAIKAEIHQLLNKQEYESIEAKLAAYQGAIRSALQQEEGKQAQSSQTSAQTQTNTNRVIDVPTTDEFKVIVNKKHPLPSTYNPGENAVAQKAFMQLKYDMQELGFAISDYYSGFRSYDYQKQLYESYVQKDGQAQADRYSARPGYSEHQTGLAFDFVDTSGELLGEGIQDGAVEWLAQNAHRYGFVVRYTQGKEAITGYMAETWHIRFIGNDATAVYQSGLTLEEFYGVPGGDYE